MRSERAKIVFDPRRRLHLRASLGEPLLLAVLDLERGNFVDRKVEPFAVAIGVGERLTLSCELVLERAAPGPGLLDRADVEPPECIEQGACRRRLDLASDDRTA